MTNAYPKMEKTPSQEGDGPGQRPAAHDGSMIDLVIRSTELDEMEDITNSLISSHRLRPLTSEGVFDSTLQIHGVPDFCGFRADKADDGRMAFVMPLKRRGPFVKDRSEFDMSAERGVPRRPSQNSQSER
jgi:hypothetical protein